MASTLSSRKSGQDLKERTWRQELMQRPWRFVPHGCLLMLSKDSSPGVALPILGCSLINNQLRKCTRVLPSGQTGEGMFSVKVLSSEITLACVVVNTVANAFGF